MNAPLKRLQKLSDEQLIDVVKNHRQYGYEESLRTAALSILAERGVDEEQLKLTGKLHNQSYEDVVAAFKAFKRTSTLAFAFYCLFILFYGGLHLMNNPSETFTSLIFWGMGGCFILYLVLLLKSFGLQEKFYTKMGKNPEDVGWYLYFLVGMPFYFILYFYLMAQMKERLKWYE